MDRVASVKRYACEDTRYACVRNTMAKMLATDMDVSELVSHDDEDFDLLTNELFWSSGFFKALLESFGTSDDEDTEDADDSDESDAEPPVKKTRISQPRRDPKTSRWWADLQRVREPDCPKYFTKRWNRRFRLPIDTFDSLLELCESKG